MTRTAASFVNSANAWWFAQTDALGHRMSHWLQPASNTYTLVQESTDGLRPETVMDWLTPYTSGTPGTTIHRDFVLGPDPDEYLAWVDTDGSIRYPMTDREGTVIAQAEAGKAKQIATYDVYGESAAPISEAGPGGAAFPFRYTGQRLDPSTAFYGYKARDYAPALGRFLQPDPAGLDQGPNLYEYVADDPLSAGDPGGECGGHGGNACGPDLSDIEGTSVSSSRLGGDSGSSSVAAFGGSSNGIGGRLASGTPGARQPRAAGGPALPFKRIQTLVRENNESNQRDEVIIAMAYKESRFRPGARSLESSAEGLLMVTRGAVKDVNATNRAAFSYTNMLDPVQNIRAGSAYLSIRIERAHGLAGGLAGYGTGAPYADSILRAARDLESGPPDPMGVLQKDIGP